MTQPTTEPTSQSDASRSTRPSSLPPRRSVPPVAARVLVVDDDPNERIPLERLLRAEGFVVSTASNGAEALEVAAQTRPDVVLTDLVMEPMGGVELCGRLHAVDPDLPVLVMTAMTDRQLVIDSLRVGAEDYLTKPVDWEAALWRVNRAIARRVSKLDQERLRRTLNERLVISSIREQEHADAEARQRAQLNALLENLHEGVVIAEIGGRISMANAAARALLELTGEDLPTVEALCARPSYDLEEQPLPAERHPLLRALRGEPFDDFEWNHVRTGGERRRLVSNGTSIRDERGGVALAIVVFHDITEQRRLEQHREEYTALVTHDLRNPLSTIAMALAILEDSAKGPGFPRQEILELAERAQRNVARITHMLDELVEATSLELGGVEIQRCSADLRAILKSALDGIDDERARRITIEADAETSFPILADAPKLERVVANLLTNALKYSAPDTRVTAKLSRREGEVRLDVIDRGIGIAPESMHMLFDRYGRTRAARAKASGLGLGLYIARLIVEAHGGRIEVASELGRGSTFSLVMSSVENG